MSKKIKSFLSKKNKKKLVCLTSYSKSISKILDKYCDLILVGDSLANVLYGMKTTHNLKLETMINHAKSVKFGAKKSTVSIISLATCSRISSQFSPFGKSGLKY